jgi:YidC/Oxa1 family membrane protein insertase
LAEYRNPQQDPNSPMDTRRMVMVFAFTFIMMMVAQQFLFKNNKPSPSAQEAAKQQQQQQTAQSSAQPTAAPAVAGAAQKSAAPVKQATAETETIVENDLYKITFTNRGGQVKSWILKKYKDEKGNPLELVHTQAAQEWGYPLSFWTGNSDLTTKLNSAMYVEGEVAGILMGEETAKINVEASQPGSHTLKAPTTIVFEYSDGDLVAKKTFAFQANSYVVNVATEVTHGGAYVTALPAWPAGFGDVTLPATYAQQRIDYEFGDNLERLKPDKKGKEISSGNVIRGPLSWGGALDQYFAAVFLPDKPKEASLVTLRNAIEIPKDAKHPEGDKQKLEVLGAAAGTLNAPVSERLFAGPKDVDVLGSVRANGPEGQPNAGPDLKSTLDFGMFAIIARPLFAWAKWTQQHVVSNWGWCIVVLTVIINLVLLPLRISSMKSMLKMQKVQPQMKAIQDRYKKLKMTDPKRQDMNVEIGELYKKHGINPLGGCLPIVIQMPFLFAFYAMLANVTELRQANWLWIKDLSSPDPWFLIPILVVVTQLILQRMSPSGGMDPQQQKMMNLMMPLMIGFFSYSVASGLGVYWITGVVVMIIQQMIMNRTELGQEIRRVRSGK